MKTCRDCLETKDKKEFGIRQPICKPCRSKKMSQRYLDKKEYIDKKNKEWYQINKLKVLEKMKADRIANPEKHKFERRLKKYGITKEQYNKTLNEQNNKCFICENHFNDTPAIDHCHETNTFRGLLCDNCNTALGLLKDNIESLKRSIEYLSKYKK